MVQWAKLVHERFSAQGTDAVARYFRSAVNRPRAKEAPILRKYTK